MKRYSENKNSGTLNWSSEKGSTWRPDYRFPNSDRERATRNMPWHLRGI